MTTAYGTRTLNVTVLMVCVDPVVAGQVLDAAEDRNWAVTEATFDRYMSAKRRPHFGEHLKSTDACVAIVDFDQDAEQAIQATAYLQQVFAGKIVLVALSASSDQHLMLQAMRAGCTEFLTRPFDEAMFDAACARFEEQFSTRSAKLGASGSVVAFFGAKGGVGTTTLAVHLAAYLVQNNKKKTLLIDKHRQFGHACIYLGIDGSGFHFQELVRNVNRLDSELLTGFVTKTAGGLDVLSSPDIGHDARTMNADDVAGTLDFLRSEYDYIVVDCDPTLDDTNLAVIAAASQVYVVATPEISAIRDLSRYCDDLVRLDDTQNKIKVALNRYSSQFAVGLEHIEKAIRLPVTFTIPNSYVELVRSANLGVPVSCDQKSVFSEEVRRWANGLVGVQEPVAQASTAKASNSLLKRLESKLGGLLDPGILSSKKRA